MICLMENGRRRLTAAGWDGSAPSAAAAGKHHLSLEPVHPVPSTMDSTKPLFDQWVREREKKVSSCLSSHIPLGSSSVILLLLLLLLTIP